MKYAFLWVLLFVAACVSAQETGCIMLNEGHEATLEWGEDLDGYHAFFIGEFHGIYGTPEVRIALLKYLNERFGIADVFIEAGYGAAWLYNEYLRTGDTTYISDPDLIYAIRPQEKKFWHELYARNTHPAHKIRIHGSDFERIEFLKVMKLLMPAKKDWPGAIADELQYIDTVSIPRLAKLQSDAGRKQFAVYKRIQESYRKHKRYYRTFYGDSAEIIDDMLRNASSFADPGNREESMLENIRNQVDRLGISKFVTVNGMNHGNRQRAGALAAKLEEIPGLKHHVADLSMLCDNCYDMRRPPGQRQVKFAGPGTYDRDDSLMTRLYRNHMNGPCKYVIVPANMIKDPIYRGTADFVVLMKDQPDK